MENKNIEDRYIKAKRRVEKIKSFYIHAAWYVVINLFVLAMQAYHNYEDGEFIFDLNFGMALMWGIGLGFHGLSVFGRSLFFNKQWEERKLKEFMEEDNRQQERWE